MATIPGTQVINKIVPTDTLDTYPTHDDKYGAGGLHTDILDITERNNIPSERRKQGMIVYVKNPTPTNYQLVGGITNSNWVVLSSGGGSSGGLTVIGTINSEYTASANQDIPVDSTTTPFTIFLPSSPNNGDIIKITDIAGALSINNIMIDPSGKKINGVIENLFLDVDYSVTIFQYFSSTDTWVVQ